MLSKRARNTAAIFCGLVLMISAAAQADDWSHKSFKTVGGGTLEFDFPKSWGKKPEYKIFDSVTDIQFGPFGTRAKPIFLVRLQAVVAVEPISDTDLMEITKLEVENFRNTAFETDIPVSDFEGPNITAHLFSITDKESKRGEFDYLTMAIISSGPLLIKCYFFSSDGAPEFGPDAMQMMRSIKYTKPEPKPVNK
jgi:hypothetical protein